VGPLEGGAQGGEGQAQVGFVGLDESRRVAGEEIILKNSEYYTKLIVVFFSLGKLKARTKLTGSCTHANAWTRLYLTTNKFKLM